MNQPQPQPDDFAQFRGAFDRPIAPSPSFAEQLREQIELELSAGERVAADHGTNTPMRLQASTSRVQTLTANGWQGALMTAAAIAVVLAMVFGALRITTDRGGDGGDDPTTLPGSAATPSTIASPTGVAEESSGATGMHKIGPIAADLSDEMVLHTNDAFIEANWVNAAGLYGDALLQLDYAAQKWHATNVNSGNQLWTSPVWFEPSIPPATDGERLFVFVNDAPTAEFGIVALDLETGARLWHVPDPTALGGESGGQGPIVANGMVYMHDGVQTFYAIEIESGAVAWLVTLENDIAPYSTTYGASEVMPNFVADDRYLYTLTGGQFLTALNLADGSVAWSQETAARPETGMPQTTLSVSAETLYVTSTELSVEFATPTDKYHFDDSFFAAYDAATGQEEQRTDLSSPAISAPTEVSGRVLLVTAHEMYAYAIDDWSDRNDLDIELGIDGQAVVATSGSRAFVVGRSGTDIIVVEIDGSDVVQTWRTHGGEAADYWDVDRVHAWADGLMVETTFNQLYYIAPATQSTPDATPEVAEGSLLDAAWGGANRSFNMGVKVPPLSDEATLINHDQDLVAVEFSQFVGGYSIQQLTFSDVFTVMLRAIELETGEIAWSVDMTTYRGYASDGTHLFVFKANEDAGGEFLALDLATGKTVWSTPATGLSGGWGSNSGPVYSDGIVYVTSGWYSLAALNANTGEILWSVTHESTVEQEQLPESIQHWMRHPGMVVSGGHVFVVWEGRVLEKFDKASGTSLLQVALGNVLPHEASYSYVTASDEGVFVETWRIEDLAAIPVVDVLGLDRESLSQLWVRNDLDPTNPLVTWEDNLVVSSQTLGIQLLDPKTGETIDRFDLPEDERRPPVVSASGRSLFVTMSDSALKFDDMNIAEPARAWDLGLSSNNSPWLVFKGGEATVWNGSLCLTQPNGQVWRVEPAPEPAATPVIGEEIATPDAAEGKDLDAGWGGEGRTWNADIDALAPAVELLPQGFLPRDTGPGRVYQSQVFGDLVVRYIVRSSPESRGIEAIEWETGEVRWYRETEVRSGFASDGERVFIIETKEPQLGLTALDIESGSEVWNFTIGFNFDIGESAASQSPFVSDGVVYFTDLNTKVGAADATTGELIWSSDSVVSLSDAASSTVDPDSYKPYPAANFALDDRYVYVVRANRIVETLDRVTGEHVRSFELTLQSPDPTDNGEVPAFRTADVDIVATDSAIIVIESLAGEKDSGQIGESTIWALDPESGIVNWSSSDAAITGNVTIFESLLYVSFSSGTISGFDLDSGGKVKTLDVQMGAYDKVAMSSTNDHLMVYVHTEDGYTLFKYGSDHDGQADAVYSLGYADNTPIDYLPIPQYSGDELIVAAHYGTIWRLTPPWLMPIVT